VRLICHDSLTIASSRGLWRDGGGSAPVVLAKAQCHKVFGLSEHLSTDPPPAGRRREISSSTYCGYSSPSCWRAAAASDAPRMG